MNEYLPHVLYAAFRYSLGRMGYSVWDMNRIIKDHMGSIPEDILSQMISDISEYERNDSLGQECDKTDWLALKEFLTERNTHDMTQKPLSVDDIESLSIYSACYLIRINGSHEHLTDFLVKHYTQVPYSSRVRLAQEISEYSVKNQKWSVLLNALRSL